MNSLSSHLISHFFADGSPTGGSKLSFANGVWVDQSLSIKPSFKQVVDTIYKATLNHVDFQTKLTFGEPEHRLKNQDGSPAAGNPPDSSSPA
ncbi:hypothetical protein RHSIM_Rhsim07G0232900 [Rhododendron simsii]|uniref:Serpin domain-containing protein n=1 Tax=Rhododendron simsii TaxID=118357 RepID=A0A834GQF5_RHOSS|nr:hypothetical protein RHSIM_Rhsim07G0232900 [Rhododendron simsii]